VKKKPVKPASPRPAGAHTQPMVAAKQPARATAPSPRPAGAHTTPMRPAPARKPAAGKKPVKRKLALGEAVACCAAEALAASLRLAGHPVTDAEVVNLYRHTASGDDEGATILATLEAASAFGLAGMRPESFSELGVKILMPEKVRLLVVDNTGDGHDGTAPGARPERQLHGASLVLGLGVPAGPHAVLDDGRAWWSWGEPYDPAAFPGAVVEEAWAVTWPR
jgi:hypothetical protein